MRVRLGDVCEIINGFAFKSEKYVDNGMRIIRITNVQNGYIEDNSPVFYPLNSIEAKKYELFEGDILISLTGNVGRVGMVTDEFLPATLNQRVGCLRVNNNEINEEYLFHFLNTNFFEQKCIESSKGIAQKNMSTEWLKNYEIKLLPMKVQKNIVNTLNKINNLIESRQQQLKKLDELVKSRFIEMFGDPVKNEKNLPLEQLSKIGILERGKSQHRPRNAPELLGGPYPLIQTGDVSNSNIYITTYSNTYSELGLKQSKLWEPGTLCITIAANIAQTAILTFKACFPDSVVGFIPNNNTNIIFIHYWFEFFQKVLEEQAPQVAQKNINLKILSELKVILPSIELQNEFADFVKQTDKSKLEIQKSLDKLEILKKSLMQQYFG